MMMCSKCGANIGEGAKFCSACGSAVQVVSSCAKCGARVEADARFCPNCGSRIGDGRLIGDRNVIAGDVVGHLERYDVSDGGVVVKSENEAGKIVECSECTRRMPKGESYVCCVCGHVVCRDCYDRETHKCSACRDKDAESARAQYSEALQKAYSDGVLTQAERASLDELQKRLGLPEDVVKDLHHCIRLRHGKGIEEQLSFTETKALSDATLALYAHGDARAAYKSLSELVRRHPDDDRIRALNYLSQAISENRLPTADVREEGDSIPMRLARFDAALHMRDYMRAEEIIGALVGRHRGSSLTDCSGCLPQLPHHRFDITCRYVLFLRGMAKQNPDWKAKLQGLIDKVCAAMEAPKDQIQQTWMYSIQKIRSLNFSFAVSEAILDDCKNESLHFALTCAVMNGGVYEDFETEAKMVRQRAAREREMAKKSHEQQAKRDEAQRLEREMAIAKETLNIKACANAERDMKIWSTITIAVYLALFTLSGFLIPFIFFVICISSFFALCLATSTYARCKGNMKDQTPCIAGVFTVLMVIYLLVKIRGCILG